MNIFDEFDKLDADKATAAAALARGERGALWPDADANGALHNAFVRHGPKLLALARAAQRNAKNGLRIECRNGCPCADGYSCPLCDMNAALDAMGAS